jgi:hypothetical protein
MKITEKCLMKNSKKIYGPSYVNGIHKIKYNYELYKLFKEPNIIQLIKINRLKWLGHIRRMDEILLCKKLTFPQLDDSRKRGRLKLRWLDDVLQNLQNLKSDSLVEEGTRQR